MAGLNQSLVSGALGLLSDKKANKAGDRKMTTASGMSINEIALQLKKQNPEISIKDHLQKAKDIKQAEETVKYSGISKGKYNLIRGTLGKSAANKAAKLLADKDQLDQAHSHLKDFEESNKMAEQVGHNGGGLTPALEKAIVNINTKVNRIYTLMQGRSAKADKESAMQKVSAPNGPEPQQAPTAAKSVVTENHKDAASALKLLGYTKAEIDDMLRDVPADATTAEMIRAALKAKDSAKGRAEKLPVAAVPAAIESVKAELPHTDATPAAPVVSPETLHKPEVAMAAPPKMAEPVAPVVQAAVPAPMPTADNSAETDKAQQEAKETKALEDQVRAEKAAAARDAEIEAKLDDIKSKLKGKGFNELIAAALGGLVGMVWKLIAPALSAVTGPLLAGLAQVLAVVAVGVAAYEGAKWLLEKAGYKGEGLGKLFSSQDKDVAKADAAQKASMDASAIKRNAALKGTGYHYEGHGSSYVKNDTGEVVKVQDLPPEVRAKLTPSATQVPASAQTENAPKLGAVTVPKSTTAATAISSAAAEAQTADSQKTSAAPPVVVKNDNRKTVVQKGGGGGGASPIIKLRNDEPSIASMAAQLFDHPTSWGGVYRL